MNTSLNRVCSLITLLYILCIPQHLFASTDQVTSTFENYRSAILSNNANTAYKLIDKNTKLYYTEMIKVILNASPEQSKKLPALAKLFVVQCRHRIPTSSLKNFNGEALFKYSVEKGWIGKNTVTDLEITDIKINQNKASSKMQNNGKTAPFGFVFNNESGVWKIDLTSVLPMSDAAFRQAIKKSNIDEDTFIFKTVEKLSGSKVNQSVWDPINK